MRRSSTLSSPSTSRRVLSVLGGAALLGAAAVPAHAAGEGGDEHPLAVDLTHSISGTAAPVTGAIFGSGPATRPGRAICTTPTQTGPNVNTDCEGTGPHNETSIAVNPTDPRNLIGGANDYQLGINPGGHVGESVLSRAHVTFDGGRTWTTYPIFTNAAYQGTGDPAVGFDDAGNAYYATLGFRFVGPANATNPDVVVGTSHDGGRTWASHRVASGSGTATSVGHLLDKEYLTAWGDGNALVTYGDFRLGRKGAFLDSSIYATVTHDAGRTWSTPQVISGSLDEAFVSVPTVSADRRHVYVSFLNTDDLQTGRDSYYTVEVSPRTAARVAGPFKVSGVVDGATDYPIADGRQTYQDSLFRTWAAGNVATDPTDSSHLAVVWSDMRNSQLPAPADPYQAHTNSDVVVSQSFDGGRSWSPAKAVLLRNDQFMPWGAYDTSGRLRIGTFDRSRSDANHRYDYSLLTETSAGSLSFGAPSRVTTVQSDPTRDNRWFAATEDPAFPFATQFLGDYSNIAATPDGGVVAYWTDLRQTVSFAGRTGHGQDAYFARVG